MVEHERPDLQEQARQLVRQLNEYNITLTELENSLLFRLANSQVILLIMYPIGYIIAESDC